MWRVNLTRRVFHGNIRFDNQPITWIKRHRSFASYEWIESQVRYNIWSPQANYGYFLITTNVPEGVNYLKVTIKIVKLGREVTVIHCHCRRRR